MTVQAQILDLMNRLREEFASSIVLITHNLGVVSQMCDQIAVMYLGKVVEYGTARDIFKRSKHPYTEGLLNSVPVLGPAPAAAGADRRHGAQRGRHRGRLCLRGPLPGRDEPVPAKPNLPCGRPKMAIWQPAGCMNEKLFALSGDHVQCAELLTLAALLLASLFVLAACGAPEADEPAGRAEPAAEDAAPVELAAPVPYEYGTLPGGGTGEVARYPLSDLVQYRALDEYHQPAFMDCPRGRRHAAARGRAAPTGTDGDSDRRHCPTARESTAVSGATSRRSRPKAGTSAPGKPRAGSASTTSIRRALVDSAPVFHALRRLCPLPQPGQELGVELRTAMQLTMTLMEGVKWSDGAPFTMEDIRFTWEDNILDPNVPSWKTPTSWEIDGTPVTIDFHDDYTFTWNFPVPFPVQKIFDMDFLDFTICPAHVLKPHHPAHGGVDYEAYETSLPPLDLPPVSLGPWVAVEYKTDEFMVMRRNPYYWKVDEAGNQLPYMNEGHFPEGRERHWPYAGHAGRFHRPHEPGEPPAPTSRPPSGSRKRTPHFYVAWGPEAPGLPD